VLGGLAEAEDMMKVLFLGEATGASVYIVHVSTKESVRKLYEIDRRRHDTYVEMCLGYLTMTTRDDVGLLAKTNPPVGEPEDQEALWRAILDGRVDTIGTDHLGMSLKRKRGDGDLLSTALGFPSIATYLPTFITEAHHRRGLPLRRLAEMTSTNAAKIFGLYPRKGTLRPGSDADLVAVDLEAEKPVRRSELPGWSDYLPNEGKRLKGWPIYTTVRGQFVWERGQIRAERGHGTYLGARG
jgi:dihydropyrimidinase